MGEPARRAPLLDAEIEIVRALADAATLHDAARDFLSALAAGLGWDVALLWVPDEEARLLRCGASWSADDPQLLEFRRISDRLTFARGVGFPGRVWASAEPHWLADVAEDTQFPRARLAAQTGLTSATGVPVLGADGVLAVIELLSRAARPPDDEQDEVLRSVGGQLAHYIARVRAEERLRASEERASAIFEAALDCVITMDHTGTVLDFNGAAEATFGYSREQAAGRPLAELIVPPELRAAHRAGLERYVATGEATILNHRLELEGMRADGTRIPVELTVTRVGRHEPPLFAGFLRDITPRREAETERRQLLKEAVASRASAEAARVRAEFARSEAELERKRLEFLAIAGLRMATSMDYASTLGDVARAAVPHLADLFAVTVLERDGGPRLVTVAHADPAAERRAREHAAADPACWPGLAAVLGGGEHELLPDIHGHPLGVRAALTVPVRASGRLLAAITLAATTEGRRFGPDDLVVATALAARTGLHMENARLYAERSAIAHTLQQSLLPAALPAVPGLELAARYRPSGDQNEVGGDFYDVFPSGDGVWTAIIGDVSGKGAAAAALTGLTRHTLYAAALRDSSPARNLAFLNQAMRSRARDASQFCTVTYARVCPKPGRTALTLASGGHPRPLLLRAGGEVEQVETPGMLVGVFVQADFEDRHVDLAPADLLLLYTDGAVELRRGDLSFGEQQLRDVLQAHAGRPAEQVVDAVARRVEELQDGSPRDDVALLAIRMLPSDA
jgi:PAS domain S-box-containing protein